MIEDLANICDFCEYDAISRYRDVYFCQLHLMRFYLSLHTTWTD